MKTILIRTAVVAALSVGMIGSTQAQDAKRADPAKVKQVQRALEKNPESREIIFKSLKAQDGPRLKRELKRLGLMRQFQEPAEIGGILCLVDGIPYPSHACWGYVRRIPLDWTTW